MSSSRCHEKRNLWEKPIELLDYSSTPWTNRVLRIDLDGSRRVVRQVFRQILHQDALRIELPRKRRASGGRIPTVFGELEFLRPLPRQKAGLGRDGHDVGDIGIVLSAAG